MNKISVVRGQLILLGMHRSGTSCVSNLLTKMGVYFGDDAASIGASDENPKGFFERRDVRNICDSILQGAECDWWSIGDFSPERVPAAIRAEASTKFADVLDEMQTNLPWFIKEPRLCLVWPLLSSAIEHPIFIHVWRHPLEVANSLAKRNHLPIDVGTALWESYIRSAYAVSRGHPSTILSYNELLKSPASATRRLLTELKRFGVPHVTMPSNADLAQAVDRNLYRQRQTALKGGDLLTQSQSELHAALEKGDPANPVLFKPVSNASTLRLQDWARREEAVLSARVRALEDKRAKSELSKRAEKIRAEHARALKIAEDRSKALVTTLSKTKAALASKNNQLDELKIQIKDLKARLKASDAKIARGRTRIDALEHELARRSSAISNLRNRHARSKIRLEYEQTAAPRALLGGIRSAIAGRQNNRKRFRRALYLHYLLRHRRKDAADLSAIATSGYFDAEYYLKNNPDLTNSDDPLLHFVDSGAMQRRNPSPLFDVAQYLQEHPEISPETVNPLLHFIAHSTASSMLPNSEEAAQRVKRITKPSAAKRVVVYTAVIGGYDILRAPGIRHPNWDFVVFSDQPLQVEGWEDRPLNYTHPDPTRAARFIKLHPHVYFPNYAFSIWVDANIGIRGDLRPLLSRLKADQVMGTFRHPLRRCVYQEAEECIQREKDDHNVIRSQMAAYQADGFPENAGLWESNVVVRRHNDESCIKLMVAWWRELETWSRRDQLSLPVVARRHSVTIASLGNPGESARDHSQITLASHKGHKTPPSKAVRHRISRLRPSLDEVSVDFGVCVHNSSNEAQACLNSLLEARRPQDGIIIIDDASDAATAALLHEFTKSHSGIKLIRHETNQGYTQSANDVLSQTRGDWVVLINSDTVVPPNALQKLIACGEQFPFLGIVGPLSNAAGYQTVPLLSDSGGFHINQIPPDLTVADMDKLCEEISTGVVPFVPLVNGFCYAIRRTLINQIGFFDEARFPMGYGEEDDYCLRAAAAGFLCGIATDAYVFHVKSASFTSERRKGLAAAGGKQLRRKHTVERVAAATNFMKRHPALLRMRLRIAKRLEQISSQQAVLP